MTIQEFPVPTMKHELGCFLGIAGYYKSFCHDFACITSPLTEFRTSFHYLTEQVPKINASLGGTLLASMGGARAEASAGQPAIQIHITMASSCFIGVK